MTSSPQEFDATEAFDYLLCVLADKRDPDMAGFAVRLSTFIINICLAILIKWSESDVKETVGAIFLTYFTLILCAIVSLARKTLSVADAHFAVSLTRSPLAVYLVYATIRDFFGKPTHLFKHTPESRLAIRIFTIGLVISWIFLAAAAYFGGDRLFSKACPRVTLLNWIGLKIFSGVESIALSKSVYFALPGFPGLYIFYSLRHWGDIREEYRRHRRNVVRWKWFSWLQTFVMSIKNLFFSQWVVVTHCHTWILYLVVVWIYVIYAFILSLYTIDLQTTYFRIATNLKEEYPEFADRSLGKKPEEYDPAGFGQLLAASCAIQPVWETGSLLWGSRYDVLAFFRCVPQAIWDGIVFVVTGRRNPWPQVAAEEARIRMEKAGESDETELPLIHHESKGK